MFAKILLIILMLPIIYVALIALAGLLAGILGVATYYCVKYLLVGFVVLAIVLIVREYRKYRD